MLGKIASFSVGAVVGVAATLLASPPATANDYAAPLARLVEEKIRPWLADPALVEALRTQNATYGSIDQQAIEQLDEAWRAEAKAGTGELIQRTVESSASAFVTQRKNESGGLFTEIIVMDAHGLNAAISDVTSDYWQGDEAKWQQTFAVGPQAVFIDEIEFDESTQTFQSQVSVTVPDPDNGQPLGAVTVGVNVEMVGD